MMLPLRLILDTNVIVSAALKPDGLQRTSFLAEYREVLSRPELHIHKGLRQQFLQLIKNRAYVVSPTRELRVTGDPDDNKFLACADTARADYLITGNLRHFPKFWKTTKVISTRDFVSLVAPHLLV